MFHKNINDPPVLAFRKTREGAKLILTMNRSTRPRAARCGRSKAPANARPPPECSLSESHLEVNLKNLLRQKVRQPAPCRTRFLRSQVMLSCCAITHAAAATAETAICVQHLSTNGMAICVAAPAKILIIFPAAPKHQRDGHLRCRTGKISKNIHYSPANGS